MPNWRMRWRSPWNTAVMCQLIILLPVIFSNIFAMAGGYDTRCQRGLSVFFNRSRLEAAFFFWSSWSTFKSQRSEHSTYFQELQDSDRAKVVELSTSLSLETYFNFVVRSYDQSKWFYIVHASLMVSFSTSVSINRTLLFDVPLREMQMPTWHIHT
jgi:hypothetical protein